MDVFFFKQKTAYEMRISDWSSDVCSSDLSATVLRGGRVSGHCTPAQCSDQELAQLMVGEAAGLIGDYPKVSADKAFLEIHKLSWANPDPFGCSLRDIDLEVCSGEIVGIAGVAGTGQAEIGRASCRERGCQFV